MKIQTIRKSIGIHAAKERVWDVLFHDRYTRIWYAAFSPGSHADTGDRDWREGSKVVFRDHTGCGMVTRVETNRPHERLSLVYEGFVADGAEDYESSGAKAMKGGHENYMVEECDGGTLLSIESDMGEDWYDAIAAAWDTALRKIKELAEQEEESV